MTGEREDHQVMWVQLTRNVICKNTAGRIVGLTSIKTLTVTFRVGELDIDKVDLQLLLSLDTNQEGRTTTSGDNLRRIMD